MPPAVSPFFFQNVLNEHRMRLARVIDQRGLAAIKRVYDEAAADVTKQLEAIAPSRQQSFGAHHQRMVLAQIRQGAALMARRMFGDLGDLTREAQVEAVRGLDQMIVLLEKQYSGLTPVLPTADAARFAQVIDKRRTQSLLKQFPRGTERRIEKQGIKRVTERMGMSQRHAESCANLASVVIDRCEKQLAVSTLLNEPAAQTIDRIDGVIEGQWYEAERVVRTETMWAVGGASRDAIDEAGEVLPSLRARWCEHIHEGTGVPYDKRVAVDSIAMNSQIAEIGGLFTMPATAPRGTLDDPSKTDVPTALIGGQWEHSPCRPNGREIISAWRPEWKLKAWKFIDGRRVPQ